MRASIPLAFLIILSLATKASGAEMYESAKLCRGCHTTIYDQWQNSRHADSFTNPLFRESFNRLVKKSPGGLKKCFFCHAPSSTVPESSFRAGSTIREGVTCDFCHTVNAVRMADDFPRYRNRPGQKKGPIEGTKSIHHEVAYSPIIQDSKLCAGCHEFRNARGLGILTTGSEWKGSSYSEGGIHCQHCHLPRPFRDVGFFRKRIRSDTPSDHRMSFGPRPGLFKEAISFMGYLFIKRQRAYVEIELCNEKGGHMIPTGIPSNRIVLATQIFDGRGAKLGARELYFERVLEDGRGKILTSPEEILLRAEKVARDSRIAPHEKRKLSMIFPLLENPETLIAELTLLYERTSRTNPSAKERIPINSITLPYHRWKGPWEIMIFLIILIAVGVLAYAVFKPVGRR